ncbi:MAG: multiheme c-type cytochrome [Planctomycetota bacterium]
MGKQALSAIGGLSLATFGCVTFVLAGPRDGDPPNQRQLPATLEDFFHPGTQPDPTLSFDQILPSSNCRSCHGGYDGESPYEPWDAWTASMMGQSARDPIWKAAVAIANQDVANGGESCIRCHVPRAWLSGRSTPTDMSAFEEDDLDGVTCHVCHRIVDPIADPDNPIEDTQILADLELMDLVPEFTGNAQYVFDPMDTRRGPRDDIAQNMHPAPILVSPHHRESQMCATCHDVSNPVFTLQPDGSHAINAFGEESPTQNPHGMMPEQRTYSEWLNSTFATTGVQLDGRFGGNHPTGVMKSCQDCHMPDRFAGACFASPFPPFFLREDTAEHAFAGANTWVVNAINAELGFAAGLTDELVEAANARVFTMLENASDMMLRQEGSMLRARVINYTGHKLPTGYPEGRRMWINVRYLDGEGLLVGEHGAYDPVSADLTTSDTKVYQMKVGFDTAVADATNLPEGESFHLILNNKVFSDNRIPPIGFTNAGFETIRAEPVAYTYEDGQYWDDTLYPVPKNAVQAVVTTYYQTTSKEYIEFLRDTNTTTTDGDYAYQLWEEHGKSMPAVMDAKVIDLGEFLTGDINGNGMVNIDDIVRVINAFGPCPPPEFCPEDVVINEVVNIDDLLAVLNNFGI